MKNTGNLLVDYGINRYKKMFIRGQNSLKNIHLSNICKYIILM
jgi:hypothetical protein